MKLEAWMQKTIYVDIDGTICSQHNSPDFKDEPQDYINAEPYRQRITAINEIYDQGTTIVYWTARGCKSGIDFTELTNSQLRGWRCKYHRLELGKPHFDAYICDKSYNSEKLDWIQLIWNWIEEGDGMTGRLSGHTRREEEKEGKEDMERKEEREIQ